MNTLKLTFSPIDSWFFRGTRPHAAAGGSALASEFPPPANTLSGAIRTRIGEALGVDWYKIKKENHAGIEVAGVDAAQFIGGPSDTGMLDFTAPCIEFEGQALYPVPAMLLAKENNQQQKQLLKLRPGSIVHCDIGRVRLAALPRAKSGQDNAGAKPLEGHYLTQQGFEQFIQGKLPQEDCIIAKSQLFSHEARVGIARNHSTKNAEQGMLFQTEHLRLKSDANLSLEVTLAKDAADILVNDLQQNPIQRFGGEGRMASIEVQLVKTKHTLEAPKANGKTQGLILTLLSDAQYGNDKEQCFSISPLPGFKKARIDHEQGHQQDVWLGEINGVPLTLHSVVNGKSTRHGGWDIRNNQPKAVQSYVAAGSCFFITLQDSTNMDLNQVIAQLHGQQIGQRLDHGYGQLACALWLKD